MAKEEEFGRALREPALGPTAPEPASGLRPTGDDPPRGVLAALERVLSSEWTAFVSFLLLLRSFDLGWSQYMLAVIVYVQLTTDPPAWLKAERAARNAGQA